MALVFLKKAATMLPQVKNLQYLLHDFLHDRDPHRGTEIVHASELTHTERLFCPRFYALRDVTLAKLPARWVSTSDVVTFDLGHYLQARVAHWFADMGRAIGHWKCLACNQLHEFQARPLKCTACPCRRFDPVEVRFLSAKSGASCGVDLLLNLGKPRLVPVEIKTMGPEEFKKLAAPLAEHRQRTTLYLRLIAEDESLWAKKVDPAEARVLYVSKGGYGVAAPQLKDWGLTGEHFSPFKEFVVKRNDKQVEAENGKATVVKWFRAGEIGMPKGICATALEKRAKACPLVTHCFSGAYPAEFDWNAPG